MMVESSVVRSGPSIITVAVANNSDRRRTRRKYADLANNSNNSKNNNSNNTSAYYHNNSNFKSHPLTHHHDTSFNADSSVLKLIREALPSGLMLAGALLNALQKWPVFIRIPQLFILVPTLLGLKGNLEMNLASRLSTASNVGLLDKPISRWQLVFGNTALLQVQSACVAGLASTWSLTVAGMFDGSWLGAKETALICAAGISTASLASLFLGNVMCGTVIVCRILKVDPDNIATPVAASLGDLVTLLIFAGITTALNSVIETAVPVLLVVFILSLLPLWVFVVLRNIHVKDLLQTGWSPLVMAMAISSIGGIVLGSFIDRYAGLAVLVPVMNGICGNLACIYASKISTELHEMPLGVFSRHHLSSMAYTTPFALFCINIPAQSAFLFMVRSLGIGSATAMAGVTVKFVVVYGITSSFLVIFLLRLTADCAKALWRLKLDPDNYIFSLITSVGDVVGTVLIVEAFRVLVWMGEMRDG
ncbi:hypothetical protein HK100_012274 [Physocladia obscura]|uniref:SLC41A/MgtE integral membrane domain-containing protein n=1 Tax=Physocladia obscura TaxID=109957 RepID=A0AAD5T0Y3_9FUNG|nr:hypothetical protein HK100_012274 [Physocladia obscura]